MQKSIGLFSSVNPADLLIPAKGIGDQLCGIQIFLHHIHGGKLIIIICFIVENTASFLHTAGITGDFQALFFQTHAAAGHSNTVQQMKKLGDGLFRMVVTDRITSEKCSADKAGSRGRIAW